MHGEFKALLKGFAQFTDNYCENAKKVVPNHDYAKLVGVYQAGLSGAVDGLTQLLTDHYDKADKELRQQMDGYVKASGALPLIEAANKVIGPRSLNDPGALHASGNIAEKLKTIMRDIPGIVQIVIPFVGGISKLLDLIDLFIDNIRELFKPSGASSPGGPTVAVPPAVPHIVLQPCQWQTIYEGQDAKEFNLFSGGNPKQVEVRVDGQVSPERLEGFYKKYRGKKIEVHLIPGGDPNADVGFQPI
jgi:hypothetical protein